jgi:hypothetical protein
MFVQAGDSAHDPNCIVVPGTTLLCLSATAKPDPGWCWCHPQHDPGQWGSRPYFPP